MPGHIKVPDERQLHDASATRVLEPPRQVSNCYMIVIADFALLYALARVESTRGCNQSGQIAYGFRHQYHASRLSTKEWGRNPSSGRRRRRGHRSVRREHARRTTTDEEGYAIGRSDVHCPSPGTGSWTVRRVRVDSGRRSHTDSDPVRAPPPRPRRPRYPY